MKFDLNKQHVRDMYCLDPWVCYQNNIKKTVISNKPNSLFYHIFKYKDKSVKKLCYEKFININSINNTRKNKISLKDTISYQNINDISFYFEDAHQFQI